MERLTCKLLITETTTLCVYSKFKAGCHVALTAPERRHLQTNLHTFTYRIGWENYILTKDHRILPLVIILIIIITFPLDRELIILEEIIIDAGNNLTFFLKL